MDIYKMKMTTGDDQSKKRLSMEAKPGRNLLSSLSSILQDHHQLTHDVRIKYIVLKFGFFVVDRGLADFPAVFFHISHWYLS